MQKRLHEAVFLTKRQLAFEQVAEFVVEFVHATGSVDDFLSTGVERVAQRANLNVEAVFSIADLVTNLLPQEQVTLISW